VPGVEGLFLEALKAFGAPVGMLLALYFLFATGRLLTARSLRDLRAGDDSRTAALEKSVEARITALEKSCDERIRDAKEQADLWRQAHRESEAARQIQAEALRAALDVARESEEGWDLFRVWLNAQAGVAPFTERRRPDE
jgi:hypothetical protein